jgi:SAM-dependent methyltransferase
MGYADRTVNSPNPLVRFAHRRRVETALRLARLDGPQRVIDYGCGDGLFLNSLTDRIDPSSDFVGFEPFMEAAQGNKIQIFKEWDRIENRCSEEGNATLVTCFEVLEHFTESGQRQALRNMRRVITDNGLLIVSVPIEGGAPSVIKNVVRRIYFGRSGSSIYSSRNIMRSFLWMPIPECRSGSEYLSHMGFYLTDLEKVISVNYKIERRILSPFPALGYHFNSQVFYLARPI